MARTLKERLERRKTLSAINVGLTRASGIFGKGKDHPVAVEARQRLKTIHAIEKEERRKKLKRLKGKSKAVETHRKARNKVKHQ